MNGAPRYWNLARHRGLLRPASGNKCLSSSLRRVELSIAAEMGACWEFVKQEKTSAVAQPLTMESVGYSNPNELARLLALFSVLICLFVNFLCRRASLQGQRFPSFVSWFRVILSATGNEANGEILLPGNCVEVLVSFMQHDASRPENAYMWITKPFVKRFLGELFPSELRFNQLFYYPTFRVCDSFPYSLTAEACPFYGRPSLVSFPFMRTFSCTFLLSFSILIHNTNNKQQQHLGYR